MKDLAKILSRIADVPVVGKGVGLNIFILVRNVHLTVSIHTIKKGFERKLQLAYEVNLLQC